MTDPAPRERVLDRSCSRAWVEDAVRLITADGQRSADTHLLRYPLPPEWGVQLYLKDESTHPTGSLKHRLARSLFLYAICNGWVTEGSTVVEASSGSTAISEAYFARLLGLEFVAVMPATVSPAKIALIEAQGGRCHLVADPSLIYAESHRLAGECRASSGGGGGGHFMDQFTHAERATDWRGNNNIAESIFTQMRLEENPVPEWVVVGAGTGGTSATIGRWIRYQNLASRLCVVDPENSVFYTAWRDSAPETVAPEGTRGSRIEGIGRPRVEPSFVGQVIDRMVAVPDAASIATARHASTVLGRRVGGSTGTNLWGAFGLVAQLRAEGRHGSVVTLLCDGGERYSHTYFDDAWVAAEGLDLAPATAVLDRFTSTGEWEARA
ncbi:MAG: PLP-dependent cysteine synthase family protein [Mycobacteriaceae bacterium]